MSIYYYYLLFMIIYYDYLFIIALLYVAIPDGRRFCLAGVDGKDIYGK